MSATAGITARDEWKAGWRLVLASATGPLVAGRMYDVTGNYELFLWAGVIGCTIGGLLLLSLPAYPKWDDELLAKGAV